MYVLSSYKNDNIYALYNFLRQNRFYEKIKLILCRALIVLNII